ncbi:MAG: DUF4363 family protein [Oscillospiraceae bacterium]|nr:DUF4363 family protein [Oscillospiraceae bacterium]
MGRIIISIVILAVMAIGCFISVGYMDSFTDRMSQAVSRVEEYFEDGDGGECVAAAEELKDMWYDFMELSILVNDLGHAVEITSSVAEIESFARDNNNEIYAACDRAQAQIKMLRDAQNPTFWKIL